MPQWRQECHLLSLMKSAYFSYMTANTRNNQNSLWWRASLLPNQIGPQHCISEQKHLAGKTWVTTLKYLMAITIIMSKHLVWAVLCTEEEIFNTLGSGLGLRLISFTLVPGKVTEQLVLETFSKQTKGTKVVSRYLCRGNHAEHLHHLLWGDQFGGFCLSSGCCLPWP